MRIFSALLLCVAALAASGCQKAERPRPSVIVEAAPVLEGWRAIASDDDAGRIARLDSAWTAAIAEARGKGFAKAMAAEGPLLEPAASLPRGAPTPGSYHCRVIKLGTQGKGVAFNSYKPFFCYVEAEGPLLTITKQTGSQRPAGRLYPESDERVVFLGTLALGDEESPLPYGESPARDMAGVVERVAPFRWRLVIPWPRTESKLDVFELVPVQPSAT